MLTSKSKIILESIYCLHKMNEEGYYHNEIDDSLLLDLGIEDSKENTEDKDFKKADLSISNESVEYIKDNLFEKEKEDKSYADTVESSLINTSIKKEESGMEYAFMFMSQFKCEEKDCQTCKELEEISYTSESDKEVEKDVDKAKGSSYVTDSSTDRNDLIEEFIVAENNNNTKNNNNIVPTNTITSQGISNNINNSFCSSLMISNSSNKRERNLFLESFQYDFIDSQSNYAENYQNYVYKVLKSMTKFKTLDLSKEIEKRKTIIPESSKKHVLLLDLDETLIHSDFEYLENNSNDQSKAEKLNLSFLDSDINEKVNFNVYLRPGVRSFLETMAQHFQIGIFTASIKEYADSVLSVLDPSNKIFSFKLYRESCIKIGRAYVKDLRIFENKSFDNIILLDNNLYSFSNQLSNGILISSFYDEVSDSELNNITGYLTDYLAKCNDVKFVNDQVFRFKEIVESIS